MATVLPMMSTQVRFVSNGQQETYYEKYTEKYEHFDFVSPILDLFKQIPVGKLFTLEKKKKLILLNHVQNIQQCSSYSPLKKQIAEVCGTALVDVIGNVLEGNNLFLQDNMAYFRYVHYKNSSVDVDFFIEKLKGEQNIISGFEIIYWMQFSYLRSESTENLAQLFLDKSALSSDEKEIYSQLIPLVFKVLKDASQSYIPYFSSGPRPPSCTLV